MIPSSTGPAKLPFDRAQVFSSVSVHQSRMELRAAGEFCGANWMVAW